MQQELKQAQSFEQIQANEGINEKLDQKSKHSTELSKKQSFHRAINDHSAELEISHASCQIQDQTETSTNPSILHDSSF